MNDTRLRQHLEVLCNHVTFAFCVGINVKVKRCVHCDTHPFSTFAFASSLPQKVVADVDVNTSVNVAFKAHLHCAFFSDCDCNSFYRNK